MILGFFYRSFYSHNICNQWPLTAVSIPNTIKHLVINILGVSSSTSIKVLYYNSSIITITVLVYIILFLTIVISAHTCTSSKHMRVFLENTSFSWRTSYSTTCNYLNFVWASVSSTCIIGIKSTFRYTFQLFEVFSSLFNSVVYVSNYFLEKSLKNLDTF